jgi:SAM-dependent methyltransferase
VNNITTIEPFKEMLAAISEPTILNVGSAAGEGPDTMKDWAPHAKQFIGLDLEKNNNVDIIGDIENIPELENDYFDAVISKGTFEHIKRPWKAAAEICRVMKPGGIAWIHSVLCFPIHKYPGDYWRFTADAFEVIFVEDCGMELIKAVHDLPCQIIAETPRDGFIHTSVILKKRAI